MSSIAFIAVVAGILLVIGTIIAMGWFAMSRRIAPYRDELAARERRKVDDANVIVIDHAAGRGTGGVQDTNGPGARGVR